MIRKPSLPDYRIEPLNPDHIREEFFCGVPALDVYIRHQAGQDIKRNLATVYVLTADGKSIAGYYTLSSSSIDATDLPPAIGRKLPRFPIPVTLLGRMAVSRSLQGQGLGASLLGYAVESAWLGSKQVASWAVIVDTKTDARNFYLRHEFMPFSDHPDRLYLPMQSIAKQFEK